jgi:hypothetical protein
VNVGAENRNKVIAAVSLVVVAVVLMATRFDSASGRGWRSCLRDAAGRSCSAQHDWPEPNHI